MIYRVKNRQVSYGEAIGIILLENYAPFIPGDVANASTYDSPVRFQRVENFHPYQVGDPHLDQQRTAGSPALPAELLLELDPGRRAFDITPLP